MKKINFNLMKSHLSRNEMRTISGGSGSGGGGTGRCTCKLSTGGTASTNTDDCDKCKALCDANYPNYTSWICTGA